MDVISFAAANNRVNKSLRQLDRGMRDPNAGTGRLLPPPQIHSNPPTVTVGSAGGATAISGGARFAPDGTNALRYLGKGYVAGTVNSLSTMDSGYLTTSTTTYWGRVEFMVDDNFEFQLVPQSSGTVGKWRLWVDGQMCTAAPQTGLATVGSNYKVLVDWGGRPTYPKRVLIEWEQARFNGIYKAPTTTLWRPPTPAGPKVVVVGDSFALGTGAAWHWDGWPMHMAQALGWANVIPSASGGTGYLSDGGGGGKVKYRSRIAADVIALSPDIVILSGGYNDAASYTGAQVQTEAALLYAQIRSGLPSATVVGLGPFWPTSVLGSNIATDIRDGLQTASTGYANVFIDPIIYPSTEGPAGRQWIGGSGTVAAPGGVGNSDFYISSDGVHPSPAGHVYLGHRVAAGLAARLPVTT